MAMSKKDFIALADTIKNANDTFEFNGELQFTELQIEALAEFCQSQNSNFKRERWLGYIKGENGKNGGQVKG